MLNRTKFSVLRRRSLSLMQILHRGLKRTVVMLCGSVLVLAQSNTGAEDIQVYQALVGGFTANSPAELKPNILFVFDTSGSMALPDPVPFERPAYDNAFDYGPAGDLGRLYVYDQNLAFTGLSLDPSANSCSFAGGALTDEYRIPRYRDKLLFWQMDFGQSQLDHFTCGTRDAQQILEIDPQVNELNVLGEFTLSPGRFYQLSFGGNLAGSFKAILLDTEAKPVAEVVCQREQAENQPARPCAPIKLPVAGVDVGESAAVTRLRIEFQPRSAVLEGRDFLLAQLFPLGGCGNGLKSTNPTSGWAVQPAESHRIVNMECARDHGMHGGGNAALPSLGKPFARYPDSDSAFSGDPLYSADERDALIIDWNSSTIPQAFVVSGNYHDYLQTPIEQFLGQAEPATEVASMGQAVEFCQIVDGSVAQSDRATTVQYKNSGKYVLIAGDLHLCKPRLASLKEAARELAATISGVNIGAARFAFEEGGHVVAPLVDVDREGSEAFNEQIDFLPASGWTPLQESLYEAYLYFAGKQPASEGEISMLPIDFWNDVPANIVEYPFNSRPEVVAENGRFVSPIKSQCQDNNIVLFSDGEATRDIGRGEEIQRLSGRSCRFEDESADSGDCLNALAWAMANKDINSDVEGDNRVYLYTIGFGQDLRGSAQLESVSDQALRPGNEAGSQHFTASSASGLLQVFRDIVQNVESGSADALAAPSVSVEAFNRLEFDDELYFAVFEPGNSPRWHGNIKKYRVNTDGDLIDATGKLAQDDDGFFRADARSFWSREVDGDNVRVGGSASMMDNPPRKVYANISSESAVEELTRENFMRKVFATDGSSEVRTLGEIANPDMFTNREQIIAWSFGFDSAQARDGGETDPNYFLGESLHNSPVVVDYGDPNNAEKVVFFATNQGFLHAIDAHSGEELWSYIADPGLFENLGAYFNQQFAAPHRYGLDGQMLFDVGRNADRSLQQVHMIVGQRRGGSKYFALDLGNARNGSAAQPPVSKLWTLEDLPRQAQSWAKPVAATIKWCPGGDDTCAPRDVLVIAGGYDPRYDDYADKQGNRLAVEDLAGKVHGNAIYIVDRQTGELLWLTARSADEVGSNPAPAWLFNEAMQHSFASAPSAIDADFDGITDLIFAIDMAGRIWRFDFRGNFMIDEQTGLVTRDESDVHAGDNAASAEMGAGIIADLSEPGVDRRFYNSLDISRIPATEQDSGRYNIVVGSGYRAQPLLDEGVTNQLYFVFDRYQQFPKVVGLDGAANGTPDRITYDYVDGERSIRIDDLPVKTNQIELDTLGEHQHGFHVRLANGAGEKVLNQTLTNDGLVIATSYKPFLSVEDPNTPLKCDGDLGQSFLYQIDLFSGQAAFMELDKPGIAPAPVVVEIGDPDNPGQTVKVLIIGTESFSGARPPEKMPQDGDFDALTPGLNPSDVGKIERVNWWEQRAGQ